MAETVGAIQVVATINTKDYDSAKKKIEKGNKELQSSSDNASKGFSSSWNGAIAGVSAAITNKLISSISNLSGEMLDMFDSTVKFPKVLENMGASGDFASKSFESMKKFADDTIYSLDDMLGTFGMLYGISGEATGGLVKALGGVSALATNSGQAMKSWSLQITQMVSKPTVAWMDFKILLEQNPAAIAKIAKVMGKTSKQIVEDVNNGTVSTESFLSALQTVGNDNSLQEMATSSDNYTNSIGQLQASVVSAGVSILNSFGNGPINLINGLANSFSGLSDFVSKNSELLSQMAVVVGVLLTPAIIALGVQGLIAGGKLLAGILLALGPIGLVVAAVTAAVALIIMNWESVSNFLASLWGSLVAGAKWAWSGIVSIFSGTYNFFKGVFDKVFSLFQTIGATIGNAIGGAFKTVINSIINFAVGFINGFIDSINFAIKTINNIPGVNIGLVGKLEVPKLASGGITTGPTLAMIGEGSEQEVVLPLSKLEDFINTDGGGGQSINQTNNIYTEIDMEVVNRSLAWQMRRS